MNKPCRYCNGTGQELEPNSTPKRRWISLSDGEKGNQLRLKRIGMHIKLSELALALEIDEVAVLRIESGLSPVNHVRRTFYHKGLEAVILSRNVELPH